MSEHDHTATIYDHQDTLASIVLLCSCRNRGSDLPPCTPHDTHGIPILLKDDGWQTITYMPTCWHTWLLIKPVFGIWTYIIVIKQCEYSWNAMSYYVYSSFDVDTIFITFEILTQTTILTSLWCESKVSWVEEGRRRRPVGGQERIVQPAWQVGELIGRW